MITRRFGLPIAVTAALSASALVSPLSPRSPLSPVSLLAQSTQQQQTDTNSAHAAAAQNASGTPAAAIPNDAAFNERARAVNEEIRCPVCQGISIQESPSAEATAMKEIIRERLAAGQTEDQIKAYFVEKYGDWILLEPPKRGLNLVIYLLPVILLIGGGLFVYRTARRWTTGPA